MSDKYAPKPEHKFTFGLWTVGNIGRDPFGGPVRETKSPVELVHLLAEVAHMESTSMIMILSRLTESRDRPALHCYEYIVPDLLVLHAMRFQHAQREVHPGSSSDKHRNS